MFCKRPGRVLCRRVNLPSPFISLSPAADCIAICLTSWANGDGAVDPMKWEALMRTFYLFQSEKTSELYGFADDPDGQMLPADLGPWKLSQEVGRIEKWTLGISQAVVAAGIAENGFYLWGPSER